VNFRCNDIRRISLVDFQGPWSRSVESQYVLSLGSVLAP
jgi:hypothetical protein